MPRPRPHLEGLEPCTHGGPDLAELEGLGLSPTAVLDFSVNCNPLGPPPGLKEALGQVALDRLPDSQASRLRRELGSRLGLPLEMIAVGNGSVELIRFIALACFGPGDPVVIAEPTFGEYRASLEIAGACSLAFQATAGNGFRHDIDALARFLISQKAQGLFLCNPNNPSGVYLARSQLEALLDAFPDCLLVLDEAYLPFVEEPWNSLDLLERGNLVVLRSMTKDYALGGLRLGYALGPQALMTTLRAVLPPWNVNSLAQEAGILALSDEEHLVRSRQAIAQAKEYLESELRGLGLGPLPTTTNFFLVPVGDAAAFRRALLRQRMLVRDCTSFGLPEYLRISLRTLPECQKLVEAMRLVLAAGPLEAPREP